MYFLSWSVSKHDTVEDLLSHRYVTTICDTRQSFLLLLFDVPAGDIFCLLYTRMYVHVHVQGKNIEKGQNSIKMVSNNPIMIYSESFSSSSSLMERDNYIGHMPRLTILIFCYTYFLMIIVDKRKQFDHLTGTGRRDKINWILFNFWCKS